MAGACAPRSRLAFALMACLFFNSLAVAQAPPPLPGSQETRVADGSLRATPVAKVSLGAIEVALETTTLMNVQEALAHTSIQHAGDAGDSMYWLCYTLPNPNHRQRVWIVSDGEMGGTEHFVTSIVMTKLTVTDKETTECPAAPANVGPAVVDNGLKLGASTDKIREVMGRAPGASDGWWSYRYQGKTSIQRHGKSVAFDVTASLDVKLRRGRAIAIRVTQITSS